ncbi:hypothetical protein Y032_0160g3353 [Ancylostoma ceylanicum]|nr:hypothetical protein Y032_0160g3353 [Ancylostoma ceylanicum]
MLIFWRAKTCYWVFETDQHHSYIFRPYPIYFLFSMLVLQSVRRTWPVVYRAAIIAASFTVLILLQRITQYNIRNNTQSRSPASEENGRSTRHARLDSQAVIRTTSVLLDSIDIDCKGLIRGDADKIALYENWTFSMRPAEDMILYSEDRKEHFMGLQF